MIRLLLAFLVLLGSVYLGIQLFHDSGYILITLNQWSIETSLWVGIIVLILVFTLIHSFLLTLRWLVHVPNSWNRWTSKRRVLKAQETTRKGLIEFSEGYWNQAKNHLIKALPDSDSPLLNYLTAARAAQEMGENKLRDQYLRQAQQAMPEATIAVELTQAQLQLANRQWEQALATLRHLQMLAPHHPYVLKLLVHLYVELKDWRSILSLISELKLNKILPAHEITDLQKIAYQQGISEFAKNHQHSQLNELIETLPKKLRYDPELMYCYVQFLLAQNEQVKAEHVLRKTLNKGFNEKIITLYGQLQLTKETLNFAESLIKGHPHSPALFLALGRLSQKQQLWGKARKYFEESIKHHASVEAYAELGSLLEELNEKNAACEAYRSGNLLALQGKNLL